MSPSRWWSALVLLLVLPVALPATGALRVDPARSFVNVDVKATVGSFTARLEAYDAQIGLDERGRIRTATFAFRFVHLKTGDAKRDAEMLAWLGGDDPAASFQLGALAVAPDGQGHATGRLLLNGQVHLVEMPVNITQLDGEWTITGAATLRYTDWGLKVIRRIGLLKVDPELRVRFKLIARPVAAK